MEGDGRWLRRASVVGYRGTCEGGQRKKAFYLRYPCLKHKDLLVVGMRNGNEIEQDFECWTWASDSKTSGTDTSRRIDVLQSLVLYMTMGPNILQAISLNKCFSRWTQLFVIPTNHFSLAATYLYSNFDFCECHHTQNGIEHPKEETAKGEI